MSKLINIINEEVEKIFEVDDANLPEFGERLHNLDEIGEGNKESYPFNFEDISYDEVHYNFDTEDGDEYVVIFNLIDRTIRKWNLQFGVAGGIPTDVINKGRIASVMSTLIKIVNAFIDKYKPNAITFNPSKTKGDTDMRRYNMYMQYIKHNMRPDYMVLEYKPYIVIERKVKISDKNIVKL